MRSFKAYLLFLALLASSAPAQIVPDRLTCEYLVDPQVIDVLNPRLSWINENPDAKRGLEQTAWQIEAASSREALLAGRADMWNSGRVKSDQSVNVVYKGVALKSRQDCWWRVKVWDNNKRASEWSKPAYWSMGILQPEEWKASWIGAPWQGEDPVPDNRRPLTASRAKPGQKITDYTTGYNSLDAPLLRKEFNASKKVIKARAYVTGLGYFELWLNGKKVGDDVLVPNQTNYGKRPGLPDNYISLEDDFTGYRVMYLSYDITSMVKKGRNAIGAMVGNGFYNAPINWTESYGTPRFLAQIYVTYDDGSEDIIVTDQSWKAGHGPILMNLIYDGEHYDARLEQKGWCEPGFNDTAWEPSEIRKAPEGRMVAQMSLPDRVMERLRPVKTQKLGDGKYLLDFGQEISGWVRLSDLKGKAGQMIDIKYIHQTPSGDNSYTLKGEGVESYAARFTWFVFREVEISNWPGELKPEQVTAEAVYTKVETTGHFSCSSGLLDSINMIWHRSQTDNMHGGIASDCPNRERSPYTGDGQVSCITVMHNFDARAFYNKWIDDIIASAEKKNGYVPNGAPWQPGCGGGVAWGAAICIMPWEFYVHYGDTLMLRKSYEAMKGYINYMLTWTDSAGIMFSQAKGSDGKPNQWLNLGDWSPATKLPPDELVHTFYLWRCADIAASVANILGDDEAGKFYSRLTDRTAKAFHNRFYDPAKGSYGRYGANIFALKIGVPSDRRKSVIDALKSDIISDGGHLDTGIFGTQFFFEVLAENGLNELAFGAMNQRTAPGYGWWLKQGATTSWEGWTDPGSGNHPMFGGGLVWLYRKLAGMDSDPGMPGYRHIIFKPQPAGDISSAEFSNMTSYGLSSIAWSLKDGKINMKVNVPVGAVATVMVPASRPEKVTEGDQNPGHAEGVSFEGMSDGYAVYRVAPGTYSFSSNK